ncbi:LysR substrate-binding domain-containing protein [Citrobacter portucalensis]|uniref:LysR substrate-binding domain-containing protein n=1 Tax=Citrobacter portucalensis TaxID=1639133 RepID=UPI002889D052|nr:LysR substrate-binding domain-containing protein [Citrobacter portucalensis]WNI88014.1 LysR substrate-binding domain-containing protein [Citrobacter portucalensis]
MNINLLRTFLALVKHDLNFTLTAEKLGVSQPAVTKSIKNFEQIIGAPLFRRKGRHCYQLTDKGHHLFPVVRSIVEQVDCMLTEKKLSDDRMTLNIATTHTQIKYKLAGTVEHILGKYPRLSINFHQAAPETMAGMVSNGLVDFAIATESFHLFSDIRVLPCYHWGRSLVVPRDHPLTARQITSLAEIAAYPLITYVFTCHERSDIYSAFIHQQITPNIVMSATDADIIKHYVRRKMGVGIVASCAKDDDEELEFISLDHLLPGGQTSVLVSRNLWLSDVACEFISSFAPHISDELICCFGNSQGSVAVAELPWQ